MSRIRSAGNKNTELRLIQIFRANGIINLRKASAVAKPMADKTAARRAGAPNLALRHGGPGPTFRLMNERITTSPDVCNGRPVVRGTRISVQTVLEFLAAGDSTEDVLAEYPALTRDDVQACLDYASRLMANHYSVQPVA